ncbi:DUF3742 family protein [Herbaspirillum camelliae]|uniref:DUF3742 family protein n=1 Tax=Herbaspirillum camelliae TaxID=1892903 RepID=UPI000949E1FF|nr:DUF3742 family protein [Herbaspirillum camelliae]
MSTKIHRSNAERFGRWLGGVWRAYARRERQAAVWLAAHGVSVGGAAALLWVIKLTALAILFYAVFWLALLLVFALVGAWVIRHDDGSYDDEHRGEWRNGWEGYGYYENDVRTDYGRVFENEDH